MTIINEVKSVDQATHSRGNPNADHGTGRDEQRQTRGIEETTVPSQKAAPGRLPQRAASNERGP